MLFRSGVVGHCYLLILVMISWVFFSLEDSSHIWYYLRAMFGMGEKGFADTNTWYHLMNYALILLIGILFATPMMKWLKEKAKPWMMYLVYLIILVISTAYLVDSTFNPFLYFRF